MKKHFSKFVVQVSLILWNPVHYITLHIIFVNYLLHLFLACHALTKVSNAMASTTSNEGPPALLTIYKKIYGSFANPNICKQNDFSIFQNYYLQKEIPVAMAGKIVNFKGRN